MKSKKAWITGYFIILMLILCIAGISVYDIDPFFHYHKPNIESYYYPLYNQRSQNDGISKHFEYDALITGTSMTENFKVSEMDSMFGTTSIKVPYAGATYKEINDNLKIALRNNSSLKAIIRCLDMGKFFQPSDAMEHELGEYPTYLYDSNPFNDAKYLFNRDVVFNRVYSMQKASRVEGFMPGITSFDDYSNWQANAIFGFKAGIPEEFAVLEKVNSITNENKVVIYENIYNNVISLAEEYSDVTFYYFFSPYSAVWWAQAELSEAGKICQQIEGERYVIEMILECDNIKLFSFNLRTDITTDLNNYKDPAHYAEWINSLMLKWMHDGKYQLTKDNYEQYLEDELNFYTSFDYESLNEQEDYEDDLYAAALLNQDLNGVKPISLLPDKNGERLKV